MIDSSTREVIGELLKNQSADKDKVLYDLLIDGSIRFEDETPVTKQEPAKPEQRSEQTSDPKNSKNPFSTICEMKDCKYNDKGICGYSVVNKYGVKCYIGNIYTLYEPKGGEQFGY